MCDEAQNEKGINYAPSTIVHMWILFVVQYYIFGLVRFKDISILNQLDMLRSITPNLSADIRRMEFCVLSFQ